MVDYVEAIKRPFSDLKKSGLAAIFIWIPIVNFLSFGYFLECAKTSNKKELPNWESFGDKFVRGFLYFVIGLIYAIPLMIVMGSMLIKIMNNVFLSGQFQNIVNTGNTFTLISTMMQIFLDSGFITLLVIAIILGILISYLVPIAILNYAVNYKFKDAFNFTEIFKRVFTKKYFLAWSVAQIYVILLSSILNFVPLIGGIISSTLVGITSYTIYGNVYREIKV